MVFQSHVWQTADLDGMRSAGRKAVVSTFALRLAVFFGATFLITGVKVTYLPVWLDWRGLTGAEIGIIGAAPLFARIMAPPIVALFTDRHGDPRTSVIMLAWAGLVVMLGLPLAQGFWALLVLTLLLAVASTAVMPLVETIAMDGVARHGLDYGRMRLWGSITFIVASFAAGAAVAHWNAGAVVWLMVGAAAATAAWPAGTPWIWPPRCSTACWTAPASTPRRLRT